MAEKFPIEDRFTKMTLEERTKYYSNKAKQMHCNMSEEKKKARIGKIIKANLGKKMRLGQKNSEEHNRKIKESNKITHDRKKKELLEVRIPLVLETMDLTCVSASKIIGIGRCQIAKIRKHINNQRII